MNFEFKHLLPEGFSPNSRVWIYQSSRLFLISEALLIEEMLHNFVAQWNAHGHPVKGYANMFFGQFIVLMADETSVTVSGCSTDSSVRLIKEIEQKFSVNMFDRQNLAFAIEGKVQLLPMAQIPWGIEKGFIKEDTLYFNNLAATKEQLENNWLVPAGKSWLGSRYFNSPSLSSLHP